MKRLPAIDVLKARWKALAPREQTLVLAMSAVVGVALLWWVGLAPALRTLRTAPEQHAQLDRQLQQMRTLQAEALELQKAPRTQGEDAVRALQNSATQQLGAAAQVNIVGDRANIVLKHAPAAQLGQWLAQVRSHARAVPVEAKLVRSQQSSEKPKTAQPAPATDTPDSQLPAHWDGTLVLSLPPA